MRLGHQVLTAAEGQRRGVMSLLEAFYTADEDCMIAPWQLCFMATFEISCAALDQWHAAQARPARRAGELNGLAVKP